MVFIKKFAHIHVIFIPLTYLIILFGAIGAEETKKYKYDLSVAAIFQNEAPYMKEWIEFHLLLGVQHFYLYNNLSTDNYKRVLLPYIKKGIVELIDWPYSFSHNQEKESLVGWHSIQGNAYNDAVIRSTGVSKWLAVIDLDEFLFTVKVNNLVNFLIDYEEFGGLAVTWCMFGTSFVEKIPEDKLLIESLVLRASSKIRCNNYIKSIIQPERVEKSISAHIFQYKPPFFAVNPNGKELELNGTHLEKPSGEKLESFRDKIRINHYWTRDEDYFRNVKIADRRKRGWSEKMSWKRYKQFNQHNDTSIERFIKPLRKRMGLE